MTIAFAATEVITINATDRAADIRKNAHVVNGGDASYPCPSCKGSGNFRSYTGRVVGNCFKCKGKGKVSKGVAAAAKGKATKIAKRDAWIEANSEFVGKLRGMSDWNSFAASMLDNIEQFGSLTDNQIAACEKMITKVETTRAAKAAEKLAARPTVDVSAIEALFDTARASGLKRLAFNAPSIRISAAKETSANAGGLYVKHDGEYVGKIMNGKFIANRDAKSDTLDLINAVAADPLGQAKLYGRNTGRCSVCSRELTDPESIAAAIGPICASKWGM